MKYFLALIVITLSAISVKMFFRADESPEDRAFEVVTKQHIAKQSKRHNFRCSAIGGGGGEGRKFKHLNLDFDTREQLTVEEARRYFLEGVMSFYADINEHEEFRNKFVEWPFPLERLDYAIHVCNEQWIWLEFPDGVTPDYRISVVRLSPKSKKILYEVDVPGKRFLETIHTETLEEALAILKAEGWREPEEYLKMLQRQQKDL